MSRCEYRVSWRRDGHGRVTRIYQTEMAAHRKARGILGLEEVKADTSMADMPDLVERPVIEAREVGAWAVSELQVVAPTESDREGMRSYFTPDHDNSGPF